MKNFKILITANGNFLVQFFSNIYAYCTPQGDLLRITDRLDWEWAKKTFENKVIKFKFNPSKETVEAIAKHKKTYSDIYRCRAKARFYTKKFGIQINGVTPFKFGKLVNIDNDTIKMVGYVDIDGVYHPVTFQPTAFTNIVDYMTVILVNDPMAKHVIIEDIFNNGDESFISLISIPEPMRKKIMKVRSTQ